jgi:GNAT acetyltransferase-like protein
MMITRVLPDAEYPRLVGTEAEHFHPPGSRVVVVEDDGQIVGCTVVFQAWHADCVWLHPQYRHGGAARALWRGMRQLGIPAVIVAVKLSVMRRFLAKVRAVRAPEEQYVWTLTHGS